MPTFNASAVTERLSHVEPGEYTVEVVDAVESVSKRGHEMIELKLHTKAGSTLFDFLVFTESAYWKIVSFLTAIGRDYGEDEEVEVNADDLIGATGSARLIIEEYDGRQRNKVAAWLPNSAAKLSPEKEDSNDNIPF